MAGTRRIRGLRAPRPATAACNEPPGPGLSRVGGRPIRVRGGVPGPARRLRGQVDARAADLVLGRRGVPAGVRPESRQRRRVRLHDPGFRAARAGARRDRADLLQEEAARERRDRAHRDARDGAGGRDAGCRRAVRRLGAGDPHAARSAGDRVRRAAAPAARLRSAPPSARGGARRRAHRRRGRGRRRPHAQSLALRRAGRGLRRGTVGRRARAPHARASDQRRSDAGGRARRAPDRDGRGGLGARHRVRDSGGAPRRGRALRRERADGRAHAKTRRHRRRDLGARRAGSAPDVRNLRADRHADLPPRRGRGHASASRAACCATRGWAPRPA